MDVPSQILSSATRLFARRGYDGTSLSAIAESVGIRKASLLYHFPSKEDLRRAVLDQLIQHWNEVLPRLLGAVTSGRGRFEALTRELVAFFQADSDRARLLVRELMDRPEEMRARLAQGVRPWVDLLSDYVRRGQEGGEILPDVDAEAYVVHVITLTVCGIAALPVVTALMPEGTSRTSIEARHVDELLRIAAASLFSTADTVEAR